MVIEGATAAERLAKQRRSLRKRLGMGGKMDELMDTNDLIQDEDLLAEAGPSKNDAVKKETPTATATELLSNMEGTA